MKNFKYIFCTIAITTLITSCGLFNGGGGGGHCPAYGSSIEKGQFENDNINNVEELRLRETKSI